MASNSTEGEQIQLRPLPIALKKLIKSVVAEKNNHLTKPNSRAHFLKQQARVVPLAEGVEPPKPKVAIVGAGIAGLYAAYILQELGIEYTLYEASDRIGGRIKTFDFDHAKATSVTSTSAAAVSTNVPITPTVIPEGKVDAEMGDHEANTSDADSVQHKPRARSASKTDLGDKRDVKKSKVAEHTSTQSVTPIPTTYAEMGAMRLPQVENHWRVFDLIKRVGLSGSVIPFKMSADQNNSFLYVNKTAIRKNDPRSNDVEQLQFPPNIVQLWNDYTCLKEGGRKLSADDIVTKIIQPFIDDLSASDPTGDVTSKKLLARDHHSLESYLREKLIGDFFIPKEKLEPFGLLSFLDIMASSTGLLELSLTEFVIDAWQFSGASKWSTIKGGMSRLVNELGSKLTTQVKKNCKVTKVTVSDGATPKVTLTQVENKAQQTSVYDHVIITVPLPVLRHIEFESPNTKDILGYEKREAIRDFGYDHSCKIFLRFSTRWWEQPPFNIVGGSSNTDLPNRVVVYPSYGQDRTDGVLLASYTWGTDAVRWAGMSNEDRCLQALENIIEMHKALIADPKDAHEFETKMRSWYQGGESICWTNEPTSLGAFSYLYPSQFGRMQQVVNEPVKGIVHFAGEHADIYHAWIAASLNSAYRAVKQVVIGSAGISKMLKDKFGKDTFVNASTAKKVTMASEAVHQQPATKISLQTFSLRMSSGTLTNCFKMSILFTNI